MVGGAALLAQGAQPLDLWVQACTTTSPSSIETRIWALHTPGELAVSLEPAVRRCFCGRFQLASSRA